MPKSSASSPARSLGLPTPRRNTRLSRSMGSPGRSGVKGTTVDQLKLAPRDSFVPSPLSKSVLNDNTDIEEPRRASWWKNVDNSRDITEVLTEKPVETNNIGDEFDVEILSQENKENNSLDIPESSGSESIGSIVVPQRKLFTQKNMVPQKKFDQITDTRESLAKLDKTHIADKTTNVGKKNLFGKGAKLSKPVFPAALLTISPDKTIANKTKELLGAEVAGPSRHLFGNRPSTKRKNMFADFIVSESEDEIPDIQTRRFTFTKQPLPLRRKSSASRGGTTSPASSVTTDLELDEWKCLPSSTMMENQFEDAFTPGKRTRLSKLIETRETMNTNSTVNKSRQSLKSGSSKNKSTVSNTAMEAKNENKIDAANQIDNVTKNLSKSHIEGLAKENPKEKTFEEVLATIVGQEEQIRDVQEMNDENITLTYDADNQENDDENITLTYDADNQEGNVEECHNPQVEENTNAQKSMTLDNQEGNVEECHSPQVEENTNTQESMTLKEKYLVSETLMPQDEGSTNAQSMTQKEKSLVSETPMPRKSKSVAISRVINETPEAIIMENEQQNHIREIEQDKDAVFKPSQELRRSIIKPNETKKINKDNHENLVEDNVIDVDLVTNQPDKSQNVHVTYTKDYENTERQTEDKEMEVDVANNDAKGHHDDGNYQAGDQKTLNKDQAAAEEDTQDQIAAEDIQEKDQIDEYERGSNNEEENDKEIEKSKELNVNNDVDMEQNEEHVVAFEIENDEGNEEEQKEREEVSDIENEDQDENDIEQNKDEMEENEDEVEENEEEVEENDEEVEKNEAESEIENEEQNEDEINETEEENETEVENNVEHNEDEIENSEEDNVDQMENTEEDNVDEMENTEEDNVDEMENTEEDNVDEMENTEEDNVDEMENTEEDNVDEMENTEEHNVEEMENTEEHIETETEEHTADEMEITKEHEDEEDNEDEVEETEEHEGGSEIEYEETNEEVQDKIEDEVSNIPGTPNASHDTTGRNRKKNYLQSPEAALFDKSNTIESITKTRGRNTSIRRSLLKKNLSVRPSMAPHRESTGISDVTKNSSTEGSGWDSHRNERKTLRLTLGKDFSPRKSLRALVMEKSDKRKTIIDEANAELRLHQANSTEIPVGDHQDSDQEMDHDDNDYQENADSDHEDSGRVSNEVSLRTRQATLEEYLQKKKLEYIERKKKIDEEVRRSIMANKTNNYDILNSKVPTKLSLRKPLKTLQVAPKVQRAKRTLVALDDLPPEFIEDMKYKPPKRFRASNAPWITKRLYKFLEGKLEPKYDYKARVRAEKLVETIYRFVQGLRRLRVAEPHAVAELKREMARLDVVKTHYEFYNFINEFMPKEIKFKVVPDLANEIPVPRNGVFSDILD